MILKQAYFWYSAGFPLSRRYVLVLETMTENTIECGTSTLMGDGGIILQLQLCQVISRIQRIVCTRYSSIPGAHLDRYLMLELRIFCVVLCIPVRTGIDYACSKSKEFLL